MYSSLPSLAKEGNWVKEGFGSFGVCAEDKDSLLMTPAICVGVLADERKNMVVL
jgi:hypothetical protein